MKSYMREGDEENQQTNFEVSLTLFTEWNSVSLIALITLAFLIADD